MCTFVDLKYIIRDIQGGKEFLLVVPSRRLASNTFDRQVLLALRPACSPLCSLSRLQSVKGKKEINPTLTNVNKVLSVRQRHIDSIKRANVPLACPSFSDIGASLRCFFAPRTTDSPSRLPAYELRLSCVGMCAPLS